MENPWLGRIPSTTHQYLPSPLDHLHLFPRNPPHSSDLGWTCLSPGEASLTCEAGSHGPLSCSIPRGPLREAETTPGISNRRNSNMGIDYMGEGNTEKPEDGVVTAGKQYCTWGPEDYRMCPRSQKTGQAGRSQNASRTMERWSV